MPTLNRVFSVLLWTLAAAALILGTLGAVSASNLVRFTTISDDSATPIAPSGSLELTLRTSTTDIGKGDVILVGAHSAQAATLGEVIDMTMEKGGETTVTLKAPNRSNPDQWTYELGTTTYKHAFAVPLIGKVFEVGGRYMNPWVFGALATLLTAAVIFVLRTKLYAKAVRDPEGWFKKLDKGDGDDVDVLISYFADKGLTPPVPHTKKKRGTR